MVRKKLRKLVIGSYIFQWKIHHRHRSTGEKPISNSFEEVFTAFLETHPKTPVRILFPETSQHGPGFPSKTGVVFDYQHPQEQINLNRPKIARLLIQLALTEGWSPSTSTKEFQLNNGYELFRAHREQLELALAERNSPQRPLS